MYIYKYLFCIGVSQEDMTPERRHERCDSYVPVPGRSTRRSRTFLLEPDLSEETDKEFVYVMVDTHGDLNELSAERTGDTFPV